MTQLTWSNPHDVDLSPGCGVLYFISVTDDADMKHGYIGQTERGEEQFKEYDNNIERIQARKPKRGNEGEPRYRAVHLALAKAIEFGWQYECYPLENVAIEHLYQTEHQRAMELECMLNWGRSWLVAEYESLTIADLYEGQEVDALKQLV